MDTQCKNDVNYDIKNMKCGVGRKREDFWYGLKLSCYQL